MQQSRLDHAPSTAMVLERGGRFYVYQPGLALVASGESVELAYRKFSDAKRAFVIDAERAGLTASSTAVRPHTAGTAQLAAGRGIGSELGLFLAKTTIVLFIVAGIGVAGAVAVKRSVDGIAAAIAPEIARASMGASDLLKEVKGMGNVSMTDIANKAAVIVQDVQAMPQERKESLRQSVGILSREAAPIVEAWRNPPPTFEPKADPAPPPATAAPGR